MIYVGYPVFADRHFYSAHLQYGTTVLVAPIALAAGQALGARPQAFLIAVAYAASMAFTSPVASPVNTMVLGAGSYRFSDFVKAGAPLILLMPVATALVAPLFWPL